jgi:hypothetical protein
MRRGKGIMEGLFMAWRDMYGWGLSHSFLFSFGPVVEEITEYGAVQ